MEGMLRYGSREQFAVVAEQLLGASVLQEPGPVATILARCHQVGVAWDTQARTFCLSRWLRKTWSSGWPPLGKTA